MKPIPFDDRSLEERKSLEQEQWQWFQDNNCPILKEDKSNWNEIEEFSTKLKAFKTDFRKRHNLPDLV